MEDPDISNSIQEFNINLIRDVNNFMRQGTNALKELKSKVANEHEQKQKLLKPRRLTKAPSDVDLIFQFMEDFNKQKQELKVNAEETLKRFYESWESALEKVLEIMLQKFVEKVDQTSLAAEDFKKTSPSPYQNVTSSGRSWQYALETEDDTDVMEEEDIIKKTPSPFGNRRGGKRKYSEQISPVTDLFADRRSSSRSFQIPVLVESSDSESSVEVQDFTPPPPPLKKTRSRVSNEHVSLAVESRSPSSTSLPSPPSKRTRGRLSTPAMSRQQAIISVPAKKRKSVSFRASTPSSPKPKNISALWIPLNAISGTVSDLPSVYQLKVHQAKRPAFIGYCANLQSILLKYQNGQSTGKKQLDNYIQRNLDSIEVQSEACESLEEAKERCEEMINDFAQNFNNKRPAYNY